jgi:hypothetical protein
MKKFEQKGILYDAIDKKLWGNNFSETPIYKYCYPALPLGIKVPLLKLLKAKHRLFFNQCPMCNSSAPELYDCEVCEGDRMLLYDKPKEMKNELKIVLLARFKYLILKLEKK